MVDPQDQDHKHNGLAKPSSLKALAITIRIVATMTTSAPWTGPSVKDMIASHTLAENIIKYHHEPCPVFDSSELVLLRRFVNEPSSRDQILRDCNMVDVEGGELGNGASRHGSLAGYIVARHRPDATQGPEPAMTAHEIEVLKKWFESGAADAEMEGAAETGRST